MTPPFASPQWTVVLVAVGAAVGFALIVLAGLRIYGARGTRVRGELSEMETAYLLGGPARALEAATFALARDTWIRADGAGVFRSLFAESDQSLEPLEAELLETCLARGGLTIAQIVRLRLPALQDIENGLIERGLLLKRSRLQWSTRIATAPLVVEIVIAVYGLVRAHIGVEQVVAGARLLALVFVLGHVRALFQPITAQGDEKRAQVRQAIARRRQQARRNGEDSTYDRMWALKDDVLLGGLRTVIGSAFAPSASFVSESETKEPDDAPISRRA